MTGLLTREEATSTLRTYTMLRVLMGTGIVMGQCVFERVTGITTDLGQLIRGVVPNSSDNANVK